MKAEEPAREESRDLSLLCFVFYGTSHLVISHFFSSREEQEAREVLFSYIVVSTMRFHLSEQRRRVRRYVAHIPFSVFTPTLTAFGVLVLSATGKEGAKEVTVRVPCRNPSA